MRRGLLVAPAGFSYLRRLSSRTIFSAILGIGAAAALSSCGARTGFDADTAGDAEGAQDAGADTGPVACAPGTIALTRAVPALMFLLDRSGSMGDQLATGPGSDSRWRVLTNALAATLPPVDGSMEIGALLFPVGAAGNLSCSVSSTADIELGTGHAGLLLDKMRATRPGGATPTAGALKTAAGLLLGARAATRARAMVLATDGAPNCNATLEPRTCRCTSPTPVCPRSTTCLDDARTVDEIRSYASSGLPTYVIGILSAGDTDFSGVLDAMADAGGRPQTGGPRRYYAARSEPELTAALVSIRDQVGSCTYLTTSVPDGGGSIVVTIDGVPIPYDPTGAQGWTWSNQRNGEILLVGDVCALAAGTANPNLVAQVTCGPGDASADGGDGGDGDARSDGDSAD